MERIEAALQYAAWASQSAAGKKEHRDGVLFKAPAKLDFLHLVPVHTNTSEGYAVHTLTRAHLRRREGFALTDAGTDLTGALDQANYCIKCHNQGKDSCSHGLTRERTAIQGQRFWRQEQLRRQAGCPLEEKISEMNLLKGDGVPIGALAVIVPSTTRWPRPRDTVSATTA